MIFVFAQRLRGQGGLQVRLYLVVLLQDVVHLGDVLAGHGFDNKAVVVACQEAVPEATLGVAVDGGAPSQGVLSEQK